MQSLKDLRDLSIMTGVFMAGICVIYLGNKLSAELVKVLSFVTLQEDESHRTAMMASQSSEKLFLVAVCPAGTEHMKNHLLLFFIGIEDVFFS